MQKLWSSDQYDPVKYALVVASFSRGCRNHTTPARVLGRKASRACQRHHRTGPAQTAEPVERSRNSKPGRSSLLRKSAATKPAIDFFHDSFRPPHSVSEGSLASRPFSGR
jgi:hypothetical protein